MPADARRCLCGSFSRQCGDNELDGHLWNSLFCYQGLFLRRNYLKNLDDSVEAWQCFYDHASGCSPDSDKVRQTRLKRLRG